MTMISLEGEFGKDVSAETTGLVGSERRVSPGPRTPRAPLWAAPADHVWTFPTRRPTGGGRRGAAGEPWTWVGPAGRAAAESSRFPDWLAGCLASPSSSCRSRLHPPATSATAPGRCSVTPGRRPRRGARGVARARPPPSDPPAPGFGRDPLFLASRPRAGPCPRAGGDGDASDGPGGAGVRRDAGTPAGVRSLGASRTDCRWEGRRGGRAGCGEGAAKEWSLGGRTGGRGQVLGRERNGKREKWSWRQRKGVDPERRGGADEKQARRVKRGGRGVGEGTKNRRGGPLAGEWH